MQTELEFIERRVKGREERKKERQGEREKEMGEQRAACLFRRTAGREWEWVELVF